MVLSVSGSGQGLRLTVNLEMEEYMDGPMSGSGVMVLLHDPMVLPQMRDLAYAISPGSHTLLPVSRTEVPLKTIVHLRDTPWIG